MLKIRLQRVGKKHDPSFRVILTDAKQGPKSGKFIENLGFYDAIRKIKQIKADRVKYWISNGAQVSDTAYNILVGEKVIEGKKINVLPKKTPIIKETQSEDKNIIPNEAVKEEKIEEVKTEISESVAVEEIKEPVSEDK
ncbi:MAG: 30S ribosomal protein S16 [Patescibacteria group bacterium]